MSRINLNSDLNKTNAVEFEYFSKLIINTLSQVQEDILPLCGKHALSDIVVFKDAASSYLNNVFSNDGIHILKNTEYINPIQTYIVNYIRYIAERVEDSASDGTSTAIFISSALIKILFETLVETHDRNYGNTRGIMDITHRIKKDLVKDLLNVKKSMQDQVIFLNDLSREEKAKAIYRLAYISGKGNEVLAQCAVDLYLDIPELLYKYVNSNRSEIETDTDISINACEHDFAITVTPSANIDYNAKLKTELHYDDCHVIVIPSVTTINVRSLMTYIDTLEPSLNIIVLVDGSDDSLNIFLEKELNVRNIAFCKVFAHLPAFVNNPLELNILQAVSGISVIEQPITLLDFQQSTIRNVKCRLTNKTLYFYDLFDHSDSYIHPSYINKENSDYNRICSDLEDRIRTIESAHENRNSQLDLNEFVRLYTSMVCSRLPKLNIGGRSITHIYNINVVDDVLGVVSVALKEGIIFDTIPKLIAILNKNNLSLLSEELEVFFNVTYDFPFDEIVRIENIEKMSCLKADNYTDEYGNDISVNPRWTTADFNDLPITQSFKSIDSLLDRLIETVPYLICTNRVIVKDGVMEKEE